MRYNKEIVIVVKDGLVQEVYCSDKNFNVRLIDLDETDPEMLEALKDETDCDDAELIKIW
jgi:hypothetical protein